ISCSALLRMYAAAWESEIAPRQGPARKEQAAAPIADAMRDRLAAGLPYTSADECGCRFKSREAPAPRHLRNRTGSRRRMRDRSVAYLPSGTDVLLVGDGARLA